MKRILGVLLILFAFSTTPIFAQQIPVDEATVRKELERRGLKEADVKRKLEEKGIDIDNLNASQLPFLEATLEEIVQELEEENTEAIQETTEEILEEEAKSLSRDAAKDIKEAVEDGATVSEAIAEELIDEVNESLPQSNVYGQELFRDKTLKVFTPTDNVRPPDSYVLGPGDKLNIAIWGNSQEDATYEINDAGYIEPSRMSRISLIGLTFGQAKKMLERRFKNFYSFRSEEFEVNISQLRSVTVNIYGEVFNPGGYFISARNTAFNALVAAGGPSNIGSVRNIRLIRNNGETKVMDVYKFMLDPKVQEDFYLSNNDIIHVGVFSKRVKVEGAVNRPFKYELLETEQLAKLIEYAGGLKSNAYQSNIQIKRFVGDIEKIYDVNWSRLQSQSSDFQLMNGDVISIPFIPKPFDNFAEINGAVVLAGKYEVQENMRISDLLAKGGLEEQARTDIAFLIRTRSDGTINYEKIDLAAILANPSIPENVLIKGKDRLRILSQTTYADQNNIEVNGEVRRPGSLEYDPDKSIRVADAILLTGGLKPEATTFAYIHRKDPLNAKEKEYIRVDLVAALSNAASADNLELQAEDRLQIYSKRSYVEKSMVRIGGAVKNPGEFPYDESLTLTDVLTLSGGLTMAAASNRVEIFRVEILNDQPTKTVVATLNINEDFSVSGSNFQLEPFDQIIVRSVPDFELQQIVTINGEIRYPGPYPIISPNETISSLLKRAGGLTNEAFPEGATLRRPEERGFVVISFDEILENPNSPSNLILRKGDIIDIPKKKDLVGVAIANSRAMELYPDKMLNAGKINVPFAAGKKAKYYIDNYAGGIGEKGKKKLITVEHPNGEIERTKNFLFFRKYPTVQKGSVISIGRKKEKREDPASKKPKEETDWGKVIANSIAQITAVLSLVILAQRLD